MDSSTPTTNGRNGSHNHNNAELERMETRHKHDLERIKAESARTLAEIKANMEADLERAKNWRNRDAHQAEIFGQVIKTVLPVLQGIGTGILQLATISKADRETRMALTVELVKSLPEEQRLKALGLNPFNVF